MSIEVMGLRPGADGAITSTTFDYGALDAEARIVVQQRAREARDDVRRLAGLVRQTAETVWALGDKLADVQARLAAEGQFLAWCAAELPDVSQRTIYNALAVRRAFPTFATVANQALDIPLKALYLLAAPSTPDEARQEALDRAAAGEAISHGAAQQIVAAHKPAPPPDLFDQLRALLTALDYEAAKALLRQIPTSPARSEWEQDVGVVRSLAHCARAGDRRMAHSCALRVIDTPLRAALLATYPAPPAPEHEADAVPPPDDPYIGLRGLILGGAAGRAKARKLIEAMEAPARRAWETDAGAAAVIDQDLQRGQTGRIDVMLAGIHDEALRELLHVTTEGACRELGLDWPAPEPAPEPAPTDAAGVLAALTRRAAAVGCNLLIYGEDVQLVGPGGATTRYADGEEAALEQRIAALEALAPQARGIAPHCPAKKIPADWDAWRAKAQAAGGDLALSQMGIVTWVHGGRVAGHAYPHEPEQWPALCERIADALPAEVPAQSTQPTDLPAGEVLSDWMVVEDDDGHEVVQIDALDMPAEAAEAIAAIASSLRLIALGHAHAVDTPQLDQLAAQVTACGALSPGAAGTLTSVLELIASDADQLAEQQARAA